MTHLKEKHVSEEMRERGWLIEMIHNDAPIPRYWNGSKYKGAWVWDAADAIRFCREQDARDFLDGKQIPIQGKPVEHMFLSTLREQTP